MLQQLDADGNGDRSPWQGFGETPMEPMGLKMNMFSKPTRAEQALKRAKIWFKQFTKFHGRSGQAGWNFSPEDVIRFLRSKRDEQIPAWKRMKILNGLLVYRRFVQEPKKHSI